MTQTVKTLVASLAAALLALSLALSLAVPAFALEAETQVAQNYDSRRNMELNQQRVPLESVIASIQNRCPGRLVNARHDASSNRYIVRWETSRQQIVSIQADAATGQILSTGGC